MALQSQMKTELSPLDQIRMAEANVARKIALSRELAEIRVAQAGFQARLLVDEARESGKRDGQARYQEIISTAEEEARAILAESHARVETLRCEGIRRMDMAVDQVVETLVGKGFERKVE